MRYLLLLCVLPSAAWAWGFEGHRRIVKLMHEPLPAESCLAQWISAQQNYDFQDAAADPDRWKDNSDPNYDAKESTRHFLEIDRAFPLSSYPRDWEAAKAKFGKNAEGNGQVPWRVVEYYGLLVKAFASKNVTQIRNTLSHGSHYIADAFSVLHDTRNFDPNGVHQRWESDMLGAKSRIDALSTQAENYFGTVGRADPLNHIFDIVEVGNGLVPQLVAADLATPNDMTAFFASVREMTARRFGDALTLQASFIASAWVDAGAPVLVGMSKTCSMEVPQGVMVLKGYPLPTPPDAGVDLLDAGQNQVTPESDAGLESSADAGGDALSPTEGCTCGSAPGTWAWVGALLWAASSTRSRKV